MTNTHISAIAALDSTAIESAVESVCAEDWYWFPVRHHSAAVAKHLEAAIRARKPKIVFIEGPAEANELIPYLVDRKTRPPVAIYSCYQDDENYFKLAGIVSPTPEVAPRWACWYPFVEYSPELIAMQTAIQLGAKVHFIDLPHFARLHVEARHLLQESPIDDDEITNDETTATPESTEPNEPTKATTPATTGDQPQEPASRNWMSERLIAESDFYQALAAAGGYKSWDEGWDALFECRSFESTELFRRELLAFCAAARATSSVARTASGETLDRERYMLKSMRDYLAANNLQAREAMIVCGGLHVFMDQQDPTPPPDIPPGQVYTTVVPYSNFRISNLSGYGAGNRAPQFYGMQWEAINGKLDNPSAHYIVSVLQAARKLGDPLSAADAISVAQHARMLAALRGRGEAILDDLHDALFTCCCKGKPEEQGQRLQKAIDRVDIGTRVGTVAAGVPKLPIVADFYTQLESLGCSELAQSEQRERHNLDKRQPESLARSAFFHRLQFIKVPFCQLDGKPESDFESGLIFRERWLTKWSPEVEAKLIEQNLLGDTIEAACINQLKQRLVENHGNAGDSCELLVRALQMNLPHLVDQVFDQALQAIEEDGRFVSLCNALAQLSVLDRHALHHEMKRDQIAAMSQQTFARACFAMLDTASAPDDQHPSIIGGLTTLADIVLRGTAEDQRQLFAQYVAATCHATQLPMLKGALMGLSVEIKLTSADELLQEIHAFAHSPPEQMVGAGDFIHGVIAVSRASIMAGASGLVDAIDELLKAAEWEVFISMLPRIRAGMELLHTRHRDSLAQRVAEKYGLKETKPLQTLQLSLGAAAKIAELDQRVARIMADWSFSK